MVKLFLMIGVLAGAVTAHNFIDNGATFSVGVLAATSFMSLINVGIFYILGHPKMVAKKIRPY